MKLAIAGKGGAGKTTISGTLARQLGRQGYGVLALDNDLNPNLPLTVGIDASRRLQHESNVASGVFEALVVAAIGSGRSGR